MRFKYFLLVILIALQMPSSVQAINSTPIRRDSVSHFHLKYSSKFGLTGCSSFLRDSYALLCLSWKLDDLTFCLQLGNQHPIAICFQQDRLPSVTLARTDNKVPFSEVLSNH